MQALCTREIDGQTIRPKVVSSTATIRRAESQVEGLFGLEVAVFPPLGSRGRSTRSSRNRPTQTRRLAGRTSASMRPGSRSRPRLCASTRAAEPRARSSSKPTPTLESDAYMTLVGYFNSLRELGGAVRLVEDDVPARLRVLRRRGFGPRRAIYENQELTSRISSSQIPARLQQLERTFIAERTPSALPGRRAARVQHALGRRRHRPPGADGRQRATEDERRIHPGHESRRPQCILA